MSENRKIPVSLGKPSLRLRLEKYYSLIAPHQIEASDWRKKFDQIYEKYGGSIHGERKLARNLAKKYGTPITLEIVEEDRDHPDNRNKTGTTAQIDSTFHNKYPEEWYKITDLQKTSKCVDFVSDQFNPQAALRSPHETSQTNAFISSAPILDRVELCRSLLPLLDPLYAVRITRAPSGQTQVDRERESKDTKPRNPFAAIAETLKDGPYKVLYDAFTKRQRIRLVIRYVNGIRGTITGQLLGFDKHYNMFLKDAEEIYCPRPQTDETVSNLEMEVNRRRQARVPSEEPGTWTCRHRFIPQILVRGDNVVIAYLAKDERSSWPVTSKSPSGSVHRPELTDRHINDEDRIGSAGSLGLTQNYKDRR